MRQVILKIDEVNIKEVIDALNAFNLKFKIAGDTNGKVTLIESFESSMNSKSYKPGDNNRRFQYDKMHKYAIEKGFKDVTEAIYKMGSHTKFIKKFKEEYNSITNSKMVVDG